jgi:signal peptidase II
MIKKSFWSFFVIISIFTIDRLSKIAIIKSSEIYGETNIFVSSFLSLNLIWNDGIAFGLFSFDKNIYYDFLTAIIILITTVVLWMIFKTKKLEKFAFTMIFGGSLGNIFDRLYYSSVPDFIDLHVNNFHWFIFNVADIFISLGVILLIYLEIFLKKKV